MTFHYGIRNKKTQEYDYIGTYAPLEGEWIGWGTNPDGSSAEWDIVGNVGYEVDVEYDIYSYEDALEIAKQKKLEYPNNRVWIRAEFYADYEEA